MRKERPRDFPSHPALGIGLWPPPGAPESSDVLKILVPACGRAICHISGQQDS